MNYQEILQSLPNYEKTGIVPDFSAGLERVKRVLARLGDPQDKCPLIHVVGSKGKGSTVRLIEQGLVQMGYKVGSYYSPHIYRLNERIRLNGMEISDSELDSVAARVYEIAEAREMSFFEFLTVCAFSYFADSGCDYAVVEAGMGGRLDATNCAREPKCVVLTRVELEHTEILGDTIEKIEVEKLAVLRGGAKLFRYGKDGNLGLAKDVLEFVCPSCEIDWAKVDVALPGRFEKRVWLGREAIFDMAHTVESAKYLRRRLEEEFFGKKFLFVMSFLKDKNALGIIEALKKEEDLVWLYPLQHERAIGREELEKLGKVVDKIEKLPEGFVPVVCGSGYLVMELGVFLPGEKN
ncbi:MAG: Folylpolyglutamate synthase [uncultured bacterium]|nr:MAG: Folylpolyglutamate synthase [uncultured bacterium]OGJ47864.1 MAG: hypothetical protein A2244_05290 [Candidatus Peregrinibacteria bacterium RIFOXYA2_FULL_41_18]OGJ48913.1 MAG: hypothetical protein A2344_02760 [Candidatus Peregrinibacteria bacterium RIFOXYB12_FULL_41_12]OGJ51444.1 MAG: hypothetical protein A2336_03815 [Candidatus Peregrinibacteria bacterium RIFOXYB2_FULL_41_88]OGJ52875.1 MAG: hypothetical protein A2448_02030 [Candidatus Peregrinibacteria bacterium RIFOXYC2_FULL_41_22]